MGPNEWALWDPCVWGPSLRSPDNSSHENTAPTRSKYTQTDKHTRYASHESRAPTRSYSTSNSQIEDCSRASPPGAVGAGAVINCVDVHFKQQYKCHGRLQGVWPQGTIRGGSCNRRECVWVFVRDHLCLQGGTGVCTRQIDFFSNQTHLLSSQLNYICTTDGRGLRCVIVNPKSLVAPWDSILHHNYVSMMLQ